MSSSEISHFFPFIAGPEWEGTFSKFKEKPSHICFETADVEEDPPPTQLLPLPPVLSAYFVLLIARKDRILIISPWNDFLHAWIISHLQRFGRCFFSPSFFCCGKWWLFSLLDTLMSELMKLMVRPVFPRSPPPAASSACRFPEIAALVKACIDMSQSWWLMAGDSCGHTAGTESMQIKGGGGPALSHLILT